MSIYFK